MAAKTHIALFFERFVAYNKQRYAGDAAMLALFTGLQESDVSITNIINPDDGTRSASIASANRHFVGDPLQSWTPAPAAKTLKLYTLKNNQPLADLNALEDQTEAGLYSYTSGADTLVGVVISSDIEAGQESASIEAVVRAALVYDIPTITTAGGDTFTQLIGDTFEGHLEWVKGAVPIKHIPATDYGVLDANDTE